MTLANFLDSYIGRYIVQACCHSLVAALVADRAIQAWRITDPLVQQRFSLIVVLFPIVSFPAYQMINPERGSLSFRLEALFDSGRWLNMELWGIIPLNVVFVCILSVTAFVFLFQEMIPVVKHTVESRGPASPEEEPVDPVVGKALEHLPGGMPRVSVIEEDEFILFSSTGRSPTVFLSRGLIDLLNGEQLRAAVAHEAAHIARNRRPLLIIVFLIRILMFFNPVVLVEFRRIIQEEEKVCDDIAVRFTHKPRALAEVLRKFNSEREDLSLETIKKPSALGAALEDYSHNVHLESRIKRLEEGPPHRTGGEWVKFLLTLAVIVAINYFVV
ncbi:MAG: M56 family metallopeptidase [Nitrospirae bacterium]|nr:M56 family metallopeptidase [Nitrospirota bacterium]